MSYLRVRNFDTYQYELRSAKKRRRLAFDIDAALLDPHFQGRNGAGVKLLGQWIKILAWAARLDNHIPADGAWWRLRFGSSGYDLRDRLIALEWLESVPSVGIDDPGLLPSVAPSVAPSLGTPLQPSDGTELPSDGSNDPEIPWEPLNRPSVGSAQEEAEKAPEVEVEKPTTTATAVVAVSRPEIATTQNILAEFIDQARAVGIDVPARVKGQLAQAIKQLLDEGHATQRIWAGLGRMIERRVVIPSSLPNFVMEAQLPRDQNQSRFGRGLTTEQILKKGAA